MIYLILGILLFALILGPQYWARHVLSKYSGHREDIPGTGEELVKHLRKKFNLTYLKVEGTELGDHYDPTDKTVRLSKDNFNTRSLTAVTVAAHEFGHALQDAKNYKPLIARTNMVRTAQKLEKVGGVALIIMPLIAFTPAGSRLALPLFLVVILSMLVNTIVHFVTLPVEFDASFGRALPILKEGQYISNSDYLAARKILTACALTYLASSLSGLLNFWRWIKLLRR
ncbi:MAG: zinc metallopeptidase [Gammaproteobacteria bacterium]|nr:zinc metallopeptidase [Gammaproteobacteria bacterium]